MSDGSSKCGPFHSLRIKDSRPLRIPRSGSKTPDPLEFPKLMALTPDPFELPKIHPTSSKILS